MIKIRLQRRGRKKRPIHHIVVANSRSPRDGRIIEDLGRFDNVSTKNQLKLNEERTIYWLKEGAKPSDTVRSILKNQGIMYKMHLMRWGKSDEEIEAALTEWKEAREVKADKEPSHKEKQQAMLEAEEKEYQKQLKKKAEEAAKQKAKREALAAAKEEEAKAKAEQKAAAEEADSTAEEVEEETSAEKTEDAVEEQTEAVSEKPEEEQAEAETDQSEKEPKAETEAETEQETSPNEEVADDEEAAETTSEEQEEPKTEADSGEEEKSADESKKDTEGETSSDMLAKDAIEHIENTPLKDLDGFVSDDEDRVTVQRAWETKQEE